MLKQTTPLIPNSRIPVGISSCLLGQKVRFDGSHKRNRFVCEHLDELFEFLPLCPEMAIGMSTPRPTIRQVNTADGVRVRGSKIPTLDVTNELVDIAEQTSHNHQHLRGYIVCANSPTCGMERVKVYNSEGTGAVKKGVGMFTGKLMEKMPWLPIEEDGRLQDPLIRENFITRVYALHDYYQHMGQQPTTHKLVRFHSRYKLLLMANSQPLYRQMGRLVANRNNEDLGPLFIEYRNLLMRALKTICTRKAHTNTLMHIQGYFKKHLSSSERQHFSELIHNYRQGLLPLLSPLTLINHYLQKYPTPYLQQQAYLQPHPAQLKLRYSL